MQPPPDVDADDTNFIWPSRQAADDVEEDAPADGGEPVTRRRKRRHSGRQPAAAYEVPQCDVHHKSGYIIGKSYNRVRTAAREAVHMYGSPLFKEFDELTGSNQFLLMAHVAKKVTGPWKIDDIIDQFITLILGDWKYNTGREARNLIKGKRRGSYKPAWVKEED